MTLKYNKFDMQIICMFKIISLRVYLIDINQTSEWVSEKAREWVSECAIKWVSDWVTDGHTI